jgi:hypothetical protein
MDSDLKHIADAIGSLDQAFSSLCKVSYYRRTQKVSSALRRTLKTIEALESEEL